MALSLNKVEEKAPALLSLAKEATTALGRAGLEGHSAKVAIVFDNSGSMYDEYRNGSMQRLAEKALALATQFDDDGAIDFFVFDTDAAYLGDISLDNYIGSVDRLRGKRHMGTTNYAAAFKAVLKHYGLSNEVEAPPAKKGFFGKLLGGNARAATERVELPAAEPVYAIFLTDGAPNNKVEAARELVAASKQPVFWKFISIGGEIPFLKSLDEEVEGRTVDNANYRSVRNVDKLTDEQLFEILLEEYPSYLVDAKAAGLIQ